MAPTELKELKIQLDELCRRALLGQACHHRCSSVVRKEKGWNLKAICWQQGVEQDHHQK